MLAYSLTDQSKWHPLVFSDGRRTLRWAWILRQRQHGVFPGEATVGSAQSFSETIGDSIQSAWIEVPRKDSVFKLRRQWHNRAAICAVGFRQPQNHHFQLPRSGSSQDWPMWCVRVKQFEIIQQQLVNMAQFFLSLHFRYHDGSFDESKFNCPQGVAWLDNKTLFVADTGKLAIDKRLIQNLQSLHHFRQSRHSDDHAGAAKSSNHHWNSSSRNRHQWWKSTSAAGDLESLGSLRLSNKKHGHELSRRWQWSSTEGGAGNRDGWNSSNLGILHGEHNLVALPGSECEYLHSYRGKWRWKEPQQWLPEKRFIRTTFGHLPSAGHGRSHHRRCGVFFDPKNVFGDGESVACRGRQQQPDEPLRLRRRGWWKIPSKATTSPGRCSSSNI